MESRVRGGVTVQQCTSCEGVFLSRSDLGQLIENETEWHLSSGPRTEPLPRIMPGMTAPPAYPGGRRPRSYIDELFG
jgi:hypothetical protein